MAQLLLPHLCHAPIRFTNGAFIFCPLSARFGTPSFTVCSSQPAIVTLFAFQFSLGFICSSTKMALFCVKLALFFPLTEFHSHSWVVPHSQHPLWAAPRGAGSPYIAFLTLTPGWSRLALHGWCSAASWDGTMPRQGSANFQSHNSPCPRERSHLHGLAFKDRKKGLAESETRCSALPRIKAEITINVAAPISLPTPTRAWCWHHSSAPKQRESLILVGYMDLSICNGSPQLLVRLTQDI